MGDHARNGRRRRFPGWRADAHPPDDAVGPPGGLGDGQAPKPVNADVLPSRSVRDEAPEAGPAVAAGDEGDEPRRAEHGPSAVPSAEPPGDGSPAAAEGTAAAEGRGPGAHGPACDAPSGAAAPVRACEDAAETLVLDRSAYAAPPSPATGSGDPAPDAGPARPDTGPEAGAEGAGPSAEPPASGGTEQDRRGFVPPPVLTRPVHSAYHAKGLPLQTWAVPDTVIDEADYEGLAIRAASLRGDGHRFKRESRQDSFGLYEMEHENKRLVLTCVADGVGSRTMAHRGAGYACRLLSQTVTAHLGDLLATEGDGRAPGPDEGCRNLGRRWEQVVGEVAAGMVGLAERESADPVELSTTLTAALVEVTPPGEPALALVFAVGDSPAYRLKDGSLEPLTCPEEEGPIASTSTNALPTDIGRVRVDALMLEPGEALMLCTDGLSGPMTAPEVSDRFLAWWGDGRIPGRTEFVWQMDFQAKSYDDDRTAVCIWGR